MNNQKSSEGRADSSNRKLNRRIDENIVFDSYLWKLYVQTSTSQINELIMAAKAIRLGVSVEENTLNASSLLNSIKNDSAIIGLNDACSLCDETELALGKVSGIEDVSKKIYDTAGWLQKRINKIQQGA